ncbi:hypothetical protein [Staphylococcus phage LY01]|nr:hypothetical protein [Staphylococcus phage LY01]
MEYNNYYRYKLDGEILHFDIDRTDFRIDKLTEIFTKMCMKYINKNENLNKDPGYLNYRSELSLTYSLFNDKVVKIKQNSNIISNDYVRNLKICKTDFNLEFNSILDGGIFKKDFPEESFIYEIENREDGKYLILSDTIRHTIENFEGLELLVKEFNKTLLNYIMDLMSYGNLKLNVRKSELAYFMTGIYTKMEKHEDTSFSIFDYKFLLNESGLFEEIKDEKVIKKYLVKNNFK